MAHKYSVILAPWLGVGATFGRSRARCLRRLPAKPDWKTLVEESIRFMKQMEQTAALQQSIAEMH